MNVPIFVIGSINTDMVVRTPELPRSGQTVMGGDFLVTAGGKGANQAVAAARLGGDVTMVANVGSDAFGDQAIAGLGDDDIGCAFVTRDHDAPSGVALISVDDAGNNQIVVAPGANDTLGIAEVDAALAQIPDGTIVLLQLEIPFETVRHVVEKLRPGACHVLLDPAPARALPAELLGGVHLLTPNETEAELLTGVAVHDEESARRAAAELLASGVENVAVTLGPRGALLANGSGSDLIPAPQVEAIDTTAAGDCFNGALAVALAGGASLHDGVAHACRVASISVTRRGAQDSMPYASEV
jgi:ribokinase